LLNLAKARGKKKKGGGKGSTRVLSTGGNDFGRREYSEAKEGKWNFSKALSRGEAVERPKTKVIRYEKEGEAEGRPSPEGTYFRIGGDDEAPKNSYSFAKKKQLRGKVLLRLKRCSHKVAHLWEGKKASSGRRGGAVSSRRGVTAPGGNPSSLAKRGKGREKKGDTNSRCRGTSLKAESSALSWPLRQGGDAAKGGHERSTHNRSQ